MAMDEFKRALIIVFFHLDADASDGIRIEWIYRNRTLVGYE
jgi:hypothetical protein